MYRKFTAPPTMSIQSTGSLIVDVTTDPLIGALNPIENAQITIKSHTSSGDSKTVAEFSTNSSGQTPIIEIPTPSLDLSLSPDPKSKPFTYFTVEANAMNYVPVKIFGSQVFSGVQSIQPIHLSSSLNRFNRPSHRSLSEEITIGLPKLYGDFPPKIPEIEIKDTTEAGFIVLDSVIVPEFVIVHDGVPSNTSAPSYTVSFKDYVKNVASSEVYPTWPVETLRANCIAIVSFTLNRIYTEWYRNKGKKFTITNSTAYDHAFFYGRNIFDTISEVVDDVFNTYVKRPNVTQPLLTQYCDGSRSTCPKWMSQWGSKSLGDSGKTSEQILRHYYGQDILLQQAPVVVGNPESYPGKSIREGDSGASVRTIQEQLNRIAKNYPLIKTVKTDGIFNSLTKESVKTFQKIFHLTQDGIVGKTTWYKLSEIYVAVTKIGELL
ncbi:MAG: peptidoglycan-binding protein [Cellulosilyticaceae bacterium]